MYVGETETVVYGPVIGGVCGHSFEDAIVCTNEQVLGPPDVVKISIYLRLHLDVYRGCGCVSAFVRLYDRFGCELLEAGEFGDSVSVSLVVV